MKETPKTKITYPIQRNDGRIKLVKDNTRIKSYMFFWKELKKITSRLSKFKNNKRANNEIVNIGCCMAGAKRGIET